MSTILFDMSTVHIPVLAGELIGLLERSGAHGPEGLPGEQAGQVAIDCTFGGGGHARLVAQRLGPNGTLVAIDRDPEAEERFAELAEEVPCAVRFIRGGYAEALELLAAEGLRADLAYFDLGMSSMQVDTRERGFSYSFQAPLDMRMDPDQELDAREILASWEERRLAVSLREYGEERHAGAIARAIVRRRAQAPIETTQELVEIINSAIPVPARFAGGHPAKRVFQALRIAVNDELGQLAVALPVALERLEVGGRCAVISYHSGEDRLTKQTFARASTGGCICPPDLPCVCGAVVEHQLVFRGARRPRAEEIAVNRRAESARLRVIERTAAD